MHNMIKTTPYKYINEMSYSSMMNWSASSLLNNTIEYKKGLELVTIGKLITRNKNKIEIQDSTSYRRVTIKLYGKGVTQRDEVKGNEIGTKNQYIIAPGQFIMSKIDARNGAFGIVPEELRGAIVTQDFLSYNINSKMVIPDFFLLLTTTKQFHDLCQRASSGTTGRQRIDESAFLNFQIPLPSIKEQQKFVNEYSKKTDLAGKQSLKAKTLEKEIDSFLFSELGLSINNNNYKQKILHVINFKDVSFWGIDKILGSATFQSSKYPTITLESMPVLYKDVMRGKSPKYDDNGVHLILNQKCNRWNFIEIEHAKRVNTNWFNNLDKSAFTKEGDIIINSTGEGTIGRASFITKQFEGLMYDSHLLLLRVDITKINPHYLVFLLNNKYGQSQIESLKSAKSTKQTELGVQNLLKIYFPLPDKKIQDKIVQTIINKIEEGKDLLEMASNNQAYATSEFEKTIFN